MVLTEEGGREGGIKGEREREGEGGGAERGRRLEE